MVAALRPMGEVALLPKEYPHSESAWSRWPAIIALGEDTRVVMEATGRYHEPVAAALHEYGIYVTVLNPLFIQRSGGGSIRKVKTDKADAMKIAKYGLDNWVDLREYTPMEAVRQQLKLLSAASTIFT
jgi:transposase